MIPGGASSRTASGASDGAREWYLETGTSLTFRINHFAKAFCALILLIVFISFAFHNRIRSLEYERLAIVYDLRQMRTHLDQVADRMDVPIQSGKARLLAGSSKEYGEGKVKRPAITRPRPYFGRATNELQYSRAAYLEIDRTDVNTRNSSQLIGPWYLPEMGSDIGFNDMWYKNLELDANGTSIIFREDGLFLIYAQICYKQTPVFTRNSMGYKINLKKQGNSGRSTARTMTECILPSHPTTYCQTCFTQVVWFMEEKDEVYLEHLTDSLTMMEAVGQTFLGIVRFSNCFHVRDANIS